ncbi:MAG TPA: hypothetical protein VM580_18775, partial [Labilithrix sp.]|nr:hypothetical protein [Labilithrix sp.]
MGRIRQEDMRYKPREIRLSHVLLATTFTACMSSASGTTTDDDGTVADVGTDAGESRAVDDRDEPGTDGGRRTPSDGAGIDDGWSESGPEVPYDRTVQKSIHNAYNRNEPLLDQLVYHRVRSIELDIHVKRSGAKAPEGDWFVFHEDVPFGRQTSCAQLSDCLGQLAAFHAAVPKHEVVTLFVDLKDGFETGYQPADLDALYVKHLGRHNIVTPSDLVDACPGATSVRAAVTGDCTFPTLRALRGKFVLVVTGGTACDPKSLVSRYAAGDDSHARVAFVGPNVNAACPMSSYDARPNVVFFNMPFAERARAAEVKDRGLVARIYGSSVTGGIDTPGDFGTARATGAVHLATDKASFEADAWSRTHGPLGFPFTCIGCADDLVEPASVLGLETTSGDQWNKSDSGFFAFQTDTGDSLLSALVSVPSSHVEPFAKACLVARSSEDADAANVSVCRPFDANPPRAQVRLATGSTTTAAMLPTSAGLTAESPAFLRLDIKDTT